VERLEQAGAEWRALGYVLLADPAGAVSARYVGAAGEAASTRPVALYVGDRFGACVLAGIAAEGGGLPGADAVLAALAHADEDTCACLEPAWPES
jgi:hypothetical protein